MTSPVRQRKTIMACEHEQRHRCAQAAPRKHHSKQHANGARAVRTKAQTKSSELVHPGASRCSNARHGSSVIRGVINASIGGFSLPPLAPPPRPPRPPLPPPPCSRPPPRPPSPLRPPRPPRPAPPLRPSSSLGALAGGAASLPRPPRPPPRCAPCGADANATGRPMAAASAASSSSSSPSSPPPFVRASSRLTNAASGSE